MYTYSGKNVVSSEWHFNFKERVETQIIPLYFVTAIGVVRTLIKTCYEYLFFVVLFSKSLIKLCFLKDFLFTEITSIREKNNARTMLCAGGEDKDACQVQNIFGAKFTFNS